MIRALFDALPILGATVIPAIVLAAVGYALRPQGGNRWLSTRPVPARDLITRLEAEHAARPRPTTWLCPSWTVRTDVTA